jgi:long-chain acyl-CoA synthetase
MMTGAVHVPLYPAIESAKLAAILDEIKPVLIFAGNKKLEKKLLDASKQLNVRIISVDNSGTSQFGSFLDDARFKTEVLLQRKQSVQPDDIASITYLSGANTPLRGVILTHKNHVFNILQYSKEHHLQHCSVGLSFLPLAHSFERTVNYSLQYQGVEVHYCDGFQLVPAALRKQKPDIIQVVPLVLYRIMDTIKSEIEKFGTVKKHLALWIIHLAENTEANRQNFIKSLLFSIFLKDIKKFFGGRLKVVLCGGAALNSSVFNIFNAAGIKIYEGYGLTEAGPLVSYNRPDAYKPYTLGKPMPGVNVKISDDGEVLVQSGGVMQGYYLHDDSAVDKSGWLHTGDTGYLDNDGFVILNGLKKIIFKMSSGLYFNPLAAEEIIVNLSGLQHVWISGHNRNELTAVLPITEVITEKIMSHIKSALATYNTHSAKQARVSQYYMVNDEWTASNGLLNTDLSLNRQALASKYHTLIQAQSNQTQPAIRL